jgi:hypothetical protein
LLVRSSALPCHNLVPRHFQFGRESRGCIVMMRDLV